MTDREIEQAEKSLKWVVNQIPEDLGNSNEEKMLKSIRFYCHNGAEVINRLKANIKTLQAFNNRLCIETEDKSNEQKEQIRKQVAKEILHDIYQRLAIDYVDEEIGYQDECIDTACLYEDLKEIAKKYGVEVE